LIENKEDKSSATAKKIMALDKPSAMVFDANGALYVTVFGTAAEGDSAPAGQLLKIEM
jgi:hypothetical protein